MKAASAAVEVARDYYDSADADAFYSRIWGGEDIHIGIYAHDREAIADASRRTVRRMAARLPGLAARSRVLDIGAGYGGAARYLARRHGCRVVALNLSEVENTRNRELTRRQGLEDRIDVVAGNFEDLPYADGSFDVVWSQDAILHSGAREAVLGEVARVLADGGAFVFTDPMRADDCPDGVLAPILDRLHLDSLGAPGHYRRAARAAGLVEVAFEDHSEHLAVHYARVLEELERHEATLAEGISAAYLRRTRRGLAHWIDGGRHGHLTWGIFHFRAG